MGIGGKIFGAKLKNKRKIWKNEAEFEDLERGSKNCRNDGRNIQVWNENHIEPPKPSPTEKETQNQFIK